MLPLPLILASASPRRLELLRGVGLDPVPVSPGVDESLKEGEDPETHARRLAAAKTAAAIALRRDGDPPALVLAADTVVLVDGTILGKPSDAADALAMLRTLSGRTHEVLTAVQLDRTDDARRAAAIRISRVRFRTCSEALLSWYVATGEPMDKAGAYGLQGLGVLLTDGIDGSWSNVVGLPLEPLPGLFDRVGVDLLAALRSR